jgi:glycosyltransferase involved in cell wall biosynthesis
MSPRFSIVVPCYKVVQHRELLVDCLASVARQTCTDFELLLVDDGSPDDSAGLLRELIGTDSPLQHRARVIALAENVGVCGARNAGIEAAHGELIAFLDFDDIWSPRYLERVSIAAAADPATAVFLCRTDFLCTLGARMKVRDTGTLQFLNEMDFVEFCAWHVLSNFPVAMGSAVVVARSLYASYPDLKFDLALSQTTAEDVLFGFQLLEKGIRPWYIDEPLCIHRRKLERESRGATAQLRLDERQVNNYIAAKAGASLIDRVTRERPEFGPAITACIARLDLQFALKNELFRADLWFGIARCLRHPRAMGTLLRLHVKTAVRQRLRQALLNWYFFCTYPDNPQARDRVQLLMEGLSGAEDPRRSVPPSDQLARVATVDTGGFQ